MGASGQQRAATLRNAIVLAAVVALGFALRLVPWWTDPGLELLDDAGYHARLVQATVTLGHVPGVDPLSNAPQGRRLHEHLPVGLYVAAAEFHRVLHPVDRAPVRTHLIIFIALAGALTALPVYLATRAVGAGAGGALVAALIVSLLPAHLHRTFGYWVRYDSLGTLLIVAHVAFLLRALRDGARRYADAAASSVFLVLAASVWRVSLLLPFLESLFVLLVVCTGGAKASLRDALLSIAAAGTLAFSFMEPMRTQQFTRSGAWLLVVATAVACSLPTSRAGVPSGARLATQGAAIAIATVLGRLIQTPNIYEGALETLGVKLRGLLHLGASTGALERIRMDVVELYSLTPLALLVGPEQFLALGPWAAAAPLLLVRWRAIGIRGVAGGTGSPRSLLAFLCLAWALLTLLFWRNKVVLGPLVSVVCGLVATHLWAALPSRAGRHPPARPEPSARGVRWPAARTWLRAAFVLSVVATAVCAVLLATSRRSRHDPALLQAAAFLREQAGSHSVVVAPWWFGYDLQSFAGCGTVTDGLLESRENLRLILDLFAAYTASDPEPLSRFCRDHRAEYVLVPPPAHLKQVAWVAEPGLAERLERGEPLTPREREWILVRMMRREPVPGFVTAYENRRFRILRLTARGGS